MKVTVGTGVSHNICSNHKHYSDALNS